ncbi:MAG: DNA repair protein RecO [Oligoflexia bacterium]|nr:DNA repair protein RecO [Oligoflexia bacterium]
MQEVRDLAIVLRSIPFEERHRIVTALTEHHGLVSAMARNAVQSRRFGGALEPFAASEWHFVQKPNAELVRLEQAHIRRSFEGFRGNFDRLALASLLNEIVLRVAPSIENSGDLFRVHSNALAWLEEGTGIEIALLNGYIGKILQWSGNQPLLASCMECQRPLGELPPEAALVGMVADAGWICPNCRSQGTRHVRERQGQSFEHSVLKISALVIADFYTSLGTPIRQVPQLARASKEEHIELFRFLQGLLAYHLPSFEPSTLKSLRFLAL